MACCEWCSTHFRAPARWIVGTLEIAISIAIICIIYFQLTNYDLVTLKGEIFNYQCLLGSTEQGDDLCIYGYATSGISIGFSLLLMISVCFKCNCWMYVELWIDWIVVTAGWLLWVVAGIVVSYYNTANTNSATDDRQPWRNAVAILAWINFLFFVFDFLGCTVRIFYKVCGCCGGAAAAEAARLKKEKEKEEELRKKQEAAMANKPPVPQDVEAPQPPAGATATVNPTAGLPAVPSADAQLAPPANASRSWMPWSK